LLVQLHHSRRYSFTITLSQTIIHSHDFAERHEKGQTDLAQDQNPICE
jgi:hypothetical protein